TSDLTLIRPIKALAKPDEIPRFIDRTRDLRGFLKANPASCRAPTDSTTDSKPVPLNKRSLARSLSDVLKIRGDDPRGAIEGVKSNLSSMVLWACCLRLTLLKPSLSETPLHLPSPLLLLQS